MKNYTRTTYNYVLLMMLEARDERFGDKLSEGNDDRWTSFMNILLTNNISTYMYICMYVSCMCVCFFFICYCLTFCVTLRHNISPQSSFHICKYFKKTLEIHWDGNHVVKKPFVDLMYETKQSGWWIEHNLKAFVGMILFLSTWVINLYRRSLTYPHMSHP